MHNALGSHDAFSAAAWAIAPLFVQVNTNFNILFTACLTVYVGAHRSVKPTGPTVTFHCYRWPLLWLSLAWYVTSMACHEYGYHWHGMSLAWYVTSMACH